MYYCTMGIVGERLRSACERAGLSLGQVHQYEGIQKGHLSEMEQGAKNPTGQTIARLALRYRTTADYLLGLTEDPSQRISEPLSQTIRDVIELARDLSPGRQQELLAHARVLSEAELQADLREYDRMMALIEALPGGDQLAEEIEQALRLDATGDRSAALRLIDDIVAQWRIRAANPEMGEKQVEQG